MTVLPLPRLLARSLCLVLALFALGCVKSAPTSYYLLDSGQPPPQTGTLPDKMLRLGAVGLPVFSNFAGGLGKLAGPTGGYIIGYIPGIFFAGTILKNGFTYKNIAKAMFVGVLTIHIIGVLYMLFLAGLKHEGNEFIKGWIMAQSGLKIFYDFILSFLMVLVAKYARILLWIFM